MFTSCVISVKEKSSDYLSFVKFSHTLFALPFALSMFLLVAYNRSVDLSSLLWILLALIAARTSAMSFNRVVDVKFDSLNPRTNKREIPTGKVSMGEAWAIFVIASALFIVFSAQLGVHCLVLSPLVLAVLCLYSYSKRFTSLSHLILGLALALAPGGVWYALTAQWSLEPVPLMLAVMFWVAGFDILYSCQDFEFDRESGCFSLPAVVGMPVAFSLSRVFHFVSVLLLILSGFIFDVGLVYYLGVLGFAGLLFSQHLIVSPVDLDKIDQAFFTRNAYASIWFFLAVLIDWLVVR